MNRTSFKNFISWLISALIYSIASILLIFPSLFTNAIMKEFSIDPMGFGLISAAYLFTYVFMQIPVGIIFDKFYAHKILLFVCLILAISSFLFGFSNSMLDVIVVRLFMGFAASFLLVGTIYIAKNKLPEKKFSLYVGITECFYGFGIAFGGLLLVYIGAFFGWRFASFLLSAIFMILFFLLKICVRDDTIKISVPVNVYKQQIYTIFTHKTIWYLSLFLGFGFMHFVLFANLWAKSFLAHNFALTNIEAYAVIMFASIGFVIGGLCFGYLAKFYSSIKLIIFGSVLEFILLNTNIFIREPLFLIICLIFLTGFFTGALLLVFDLLRKIVPNTCYGIASGFVCMFFNLIGFLFLPFESLFIMFGHGNFTIAAIPISISSFIMLFFLWKLSKTMRATEKKLSLDQA